MKKNCLLVSCCCFYVLSLFWVSPARAKQLLQKIDYLDLSSSADQVTFTLNGPYIPKVFTLKGEKPRIVLDFSDVIHTAGVKNSTTVAGALIKRIRVGRHTGEQPKTRVVLDLTTDQDIFFDKHFDEAASVLRFTVSTTSFPSQELPPPPAQTTAPEPQQQEVGDDSAPKPPPEAVPQPEQQGGQEHIPATAAAQPAPLGAPKKAVTTPAAVPKPAVSPLLKEVRFDSTSNRGEMVLFRLNGFYPPIVKGVEDGQPKAICDFKNTQLSSDVKNIEHPQGRFVRAIRVGQHKEPAQIRVVIDLEPNNNYDLQQVFFREDNLFVIIINTVSTEP